MDVATYKRLKYLFEPVESAEKLDEWFQYWLSVQFPWDQVDPHSTSSPMQALWSIYDFMLTGKGQSTHIIAASRNSMKTLISAGVHCFSLLQMRRDDAHTAATLNQSSAANRYLGQFMSQIGSKIDLQQYVKINNFRSFELHNLPATDFATKSHARAKIVTATTKGANSDRASCFSGKTEICLWPSDEDWAAVKDQYHPTTGRLKVVTMDGLWQKMERGEEHYTLSVNPKTLQIERKKIEAIQRYIELDRLIIETETGKIVECTNNHPFGTSWNGNDIAYTKAEDLIIGSEIIINRSSILGRMNPHDHKGNYYEVPDTTFKENGFTFNDILEGCLLGDGGLYKKKKAHEGQKGNITASFGMTKTPRVREYCHWFVEKMQSIPGIRLIEDGATSGYTGNKLDSIKSRNSREITDAYYDRWYKDRKKIVPKDLKLTMPMFALWFMDDGSATNQIATYSFTDEECLFLIDQINELMGYDCSYLAYCNKKDGRKYPEIRLNFPFEHKEKYFEFASYIHPDYKYKIKINPSECKVCKKLYVFNVGGNLCNEPMCLFHGAQKNITTDKVKSVTKRAAHPTKRERWVYDIQIQDHHNFFVNHAFLVHNCMIYDEVDLTPQTVLDESLMISDPSIPRGNDFQLPTAFIYLSSRKTNSGPMQNLITRSEKFPQDDKLHKWSASDFLRTCPPEIHKPELPRVMAYLNTTNLKTIWDTEEYTKLIPESERSEWEEIQAYEGCRTCPIWIPCLSNSVKQRGDSPSLRTRDFTYGVIRNISDPSYIIGQIINRRPETKGLVFQSFSRHRHLKNPIDFYEWATGEQYCPLHLTQEEYDEEIETASNSIALTRLFPSKETTYHAMIRAGWDFNLGCDYGSVDPATAHLVGYHKKQKRSCTLHYEQTPMANHLWSQYVEANVTPLFPVEYVCPDMADASAPSYFKKNQVWTEKYHIEPGVSFIRGLLWNPIQGKYNYAIYDDSLTNEENNNLIVVDMFEHWSHKRRATGEIDLGKFNDDDYCHAGDSLRYALAPHIKEAKGISIASSQSQSTQNLIHPHMTEQDKQIIRDQNTTNNALKNHFMQQYQVDVTEKASVVEDKKNKKGKMKFSF